MNIRKCQLSDFSNAQYEFGIYELDRYKSILVVSFTGEAGNEKNNSGTFTFMESIIFMGLSAWRPTALVLDLRNLEYSWGDKMASVIETPIEFYQRSIPIKIVYSKNNREGLFGVVKSELGIAPEKIMESSVESAVNSLIENIS